MAYQVKFSEDHPFSYMAGQKLEVFPIHWEGGADGGNVRDEEFMSAAYRPGWGYVHPVEMDKIVRLATAGTEPKPRLGQIHVSYLIFEDEDEEKPTHNVFNVSFVVDDPPALVEIKAGSPQQKMLEKYEFYFYRDSDNRPDDEDWVNATAAYNEMTFGNRMGRKPEEE